MFGKQIAPRSQKLSQLNSDRTDIAKECDNCRRTKLARINRTFRMGTDAERARQAFGAVPDKNLSYLGGACDVSYRFISEPRHMSYSASVRL